MLKRIGRKVHQSAMIAVPKALGQCLLAHRGALRRVAAAQVRRDPAKAKRILANWLDQVLGDVMTRVCHETVADLQSLSADLLGIRADEDMDTDDELGMEGMEDDDVNEVEEDEDFEGMDDLAEDDDEMLDPGMEGMEDEEPVEDDDQLSDIVDDLEGYKKEGRTLMRRLARRGQKKHAAFLGALLSRL